MTLVFLSGRLDDALESIRSKPAGQAIGSKLSADVNLLRFAGLAVSWAGCWFHNAPLVSLGVFVILGAWWLAWRRGASDRQRAGF